MQVTTFFDKIELSLLKCQQKNQRKSSEQKPGLLYAVRQAQF